MEKDVKPYKQRGMTCSIACMLMILEYYKIIPKADNRFEKKYYNIYKSYYSEGTPFSAIAWHMQKNGLDTELIHSEETMFKNEGAFQEREYELLMNEYKSFVDNATKKGMKLQNGVDINSELIKEKLEEGKFVVLAGMAGTILHAILVTGYENDEFIVCDPLYKQKIHMTKQELENFMETPIGKWFVAVKERTLEKEELMGELDSYKYEAKTMMNTKKEKTLEIK